MVKAYVYVILCCVIFPDFRAALHKSRVCAFYSFPMMVYSTAVNATVDVGGQYNFSCSAINDLYKQWIYVNKSLSIEISNTSDGSIVVTEDYELRLSNIRFQNERTYKCCLYHFLSRVNLTNNLSVIG